MCMSGCSFAVWPQEQDHDRLRDLRDIEGRGAGALLRGQQGPHHTLREGPRLGERHGLRQLPPQGVRAPPGRVAPGGGAGDAQRARQRLLRDAQDRPVHHTGGEPGGGGVRDLRQHLLRIPGVRRRGRGGIDDGARHHTLLRRHQGVHRAGRPHPRRLLRGRGARRTHHEHLPAQGHARVPPAAGWSRP